MTDAETAVPASPEEPPEPPSPAEAEADPEAATAAAPGGGAGPGGWPWWPALVVAAGIYALFVALVIGNGFNPTDEGPMVSYARRLLLGDVPHRDFIYSRPAGSPLLHIVDVVLPTPLLLTSRVIDGAMIFVYALLFGCLAVDRRVRQANPLLLAGVVVAALINIHTLPLMAWYTVDGLFLVAVGLYLLRWSDRTWVRGGALLLLGYAPLTKQSFFLAPVLALWFLWRYRRSDLRFPWRLLRSLVLLGLPGLLYLSYVWVRHAFDEMLRQFTAVPPVYGKEVVTDLGGSNGALVPVVVGAAVVAAAVVVTTMAPRRAAAAGRGAAIAWRALVGAALLAPVLVAGWVIHAGDLDLSGVWGVQVLWLPVATALAIGVARRRIPDGILLAPIAGWMAMLSVGYPKPNLVAGTMALAAVAPIWQQGAPAFGGVLAKVGNWPAWGRVMGSLVVVAALTVPIGVWFVDVRNHNLYRDLDAEDLVDLGGIDPDLWGIRSNPVTADYLRMAKECVADTGTSTVAIVPDNAALYPVFDWTNPVAIDVLFPQEYYGNGQQLLDSFAAIDQSDERIAVVMQTYEAAKLSTLPALADAQPEWPPYTYTDPNLLAALERLHGRRYLCGPFIVLVHEPR